MNIIKVLVEVLAKHEAKHSTLVKWDVHTQTKVSVGAICLGCNQNFGVKK